jgi:hypothetical protein
LYASDITELELHIKSQFLFDFTSVNLS